MQHLGVRHEALSPAAASCIVCRSQAKHRLLCQDLGRHVRRSLRRGVVVRLEELPAASQINSKPQHSKPSGQLPMPVFQHV